MGAARSILQGAGLGLAAALLCTVPVLALPGAGGADTGGASAGGVPLDGPSSPPPSTQASPSVPPSRKPSGRPSPRPTGGTHRPTQRPPVWPTYEPPGTPPRVDVRATNAVLTDRYWSGATTASFTVTASNTGGVTETVSYQAGDPLPAGVESASCGDNCSVRLAPGATATIAVTVRVAPDAWKLAPVSGTLRYTATSFGAMPRGGLVEWAVVFPSGPPSPGLRLHVSDVRLGHESDVPGMLTIEMTNRDEARSTGTLTVLVPDGVTVATLPAGCQRLLTGGAQCTASLDAGRIWVIGVPLSVPAQERTGATLVGLVRASLRTADEAPLLTQASYQIFPPSDPAGAAGDGDLAGGTPVAGALKDQAARVTTTGPEIVGPIIGGSLVLLVAVAIGFVLTLRRMQESVAGRLAAAKARPGSAGPGPAAEPPVAPARSDATAVISAGPVDRTPTPRRPISLEWITPEAHAQSPDGEPVEPDDAGMPSPADGAELGRLVDVGDATEVPPPAPVPSQAPTV